jgi:glycosyltransferase involved in cell wall biosynthesis
MRLLVISKTAPFDGGGAETVVWEIGKRLARQGDEIHYLCPTPTTEIPDVHDNIHFHYVPTPESFILNRVLFFVKGLFHYRSVFREVDPDVVLDNASPFPFVLAYAYGDAPVVTKVHTIYRKLAFECKPNLLIKVGTVVGEQLYRLRDGGNIICVSESTRSRVQELVRHNPDDVHLVENSVDLSGLEYNFARESNTILCLATHRPQKGIEYLIRAWPQIKEEHPEVELKIAGSGPETDNLKELASSLDLVDVEFLGFVSLERKRELMYDAYAYVLPSIIEGHPLAHMEAMASGCVVVSTDTWGVRDVVRHEETGLLAEPKSPNDIATQVNRVLTDRDFGENLARAGFESLEEYSWDDAAADEREILTTLVRER